MIKITVVRIPQDDWWPRSFNVLVPLDIQGKEGILLEEAKPPTTQRGSIGVICRIDDKTYCLPCWAVEKVKVPVERPLSYAI